MWRQALGSWQSCQTLKAVEESRARAFLAQAPADSAACYAEGLLEGLEAAAVLEPGQDHGTEHDSQVVQTQLRKARQDKAKLILEARYQHQCRRSLHCELVKCRKKLAETERLLEAAAAQEPAQDRGAEQDPQVIEAEAQLQTARRDKEQLVKEARYQYRCRQSLHGELVACRKKLVESERLLEEERQSHRALAAELRSLSAASMEQSRSEMQELIAAERDHLLRSFQDQCQVAESQRVCDIKNALNAGLQELMQFVHLAQSGPPKSRADAAPGFPTQQVKAAVATRLRSSPFGTPALSSAPANSAASSSCPGFQPLSPVRELEEPLPAAYAKEHPAASSHFRALVARSKQQLSHKPGPPRRLGGCGAWDFPLSRKDRAERLTAVLLHEAELADQQVSDLRSAISRGSRGHRLTRRSPGQ